MENKPIDVLCETHGQTIAIAFEADGKTLGRFCYVCWVNAMATKLGLKNHGESDNKPTEAV